MPRVGFEPTISAGKRPKTYTLDRMATGTGEQAWLPEEKIMCVCIVACRLNPTDGIIFMLYFTGTILAVKSQSLADS